MCEDGTVSHCYAITASGTRQTTTTRELLKEELTTTTRPPTTTTPVFKYSCPFECCEGENVYEDRLCPDGYTCVDNSCQLSGNVGGLFGGEPTGVEEKGVNWRLILEVLGGIAVIAFALIVIVKISRRGTTWEDLYSKWGRRR